MDAIESFLDAFKARHADWNPCEIRVLPSGDDKDVIKVFLNFGPEIADSDLDELKRRPFQRLHEQHPGVAAYTLRVTAVND
jgi:hypothetical protein